jgi:hypothetical protein
MSIFTHSKETKTEMMIGSFAWNYFKALVERSHERREMKKAETPGEKRRLLRAMYAKQRGVRIQRVEVNYKTGDLVCITNK